MKTYKNIFGTLIVLVAVIGIGSYLIKSEDGKSSNKEAIKIGFVGPLSGEAAPYGDPAKAGVEIAVEKINKSGGVDGRMIEVIYEDGKCNGKDSVSAIQKLISVDKVKFVIGGVCSGETIAMAPIAEQAKVILFSPISSSPEITNAGDYIFRNQMSDLFAGKALAEKMVTSYKEVAIISENTDYAVDMREVFVKNFTLNNGTLVYNDIFTPGTNDFRSMVAEINASKAKGVFINVQVPSSLIKIVSQLRQVGYTGDIFSGFLTGPEVSGAGEFMEGIVMVDYPDLLDNQSAKELLAKYQEKYNKLPAYQSYAGNSYDAVLILAKGMDEYGEDVEKIKNYIYNIKNYQGTVGTYSFDKNGEIENLDLTFRKIENGIFVNVK